MLNLMPTYFYILRNLPHFPNDIGVHRRIKIVTKITAAAIHPMQINALSGMLNKLINHQQGNMGNFMMHYFCYLLFFIPTAVNAQMK